MKKIVPLYEEFIFEIKKPTTDLEYSKAYNNILKDKTFNTWFKKIKALTNKFDVEFDKFGFNDWTASLDQKSLVDMYMKKPIDVLGEYNRDINDEKTLKKRSNPLLSAKQIRNDKNSKVWYTDKFEPAAIKHKLKEKGFHYSMMTFRMFLEATDDEDLVQLYNGEIENVLKEYVWYRENEILKI